ncbi:hypothetical protein P152DRAFT_253719 [Eremomyces bilateralis CBS 781.70]|uniref:Hemerythrin-like domain-containing protein n=1 Tax=Eremomyces bilateralis CBS 781.70 TaxID=1392243 RepID=A0A6G1FQV5_9PEZI|nr:uncharacterized protein P152DRAFT_253719 [Eremomyces bilateralis CBS 781.70]KAF1808215.1 hypothetical protein P152DRAFT_253719 [Eremomyces bilateralis CBS 781.70]
MAPATWADRPVPLLPTPQYLTKKSDDYTVQASVMATIHNAFIRCFNTIYLQALHVQPTDYPTFVGYAEAWVIGLASHHNGEEEHFFPELRKRTGDDQLMTENEEQHHRFHGGMERYRAYLAEVKRSRGCRDFDGRKLIGIMDSFKDALMEHLADEIPTIQALEKYAGKLDLNQLMEETAEHSMGSMPKLSVIPAVFLNHDVTYEGGLMADFGKFPAVMEFTLRRIFPLWNYEWWKFASCDKTGHPKGLHCVG